MRPTCHADEPDMDGLCACASDEKRPSNISTTRGQTEYRDRRRPSRARVGLSNPTRAAADETPQQKAVATPADRQHFVRREYQTPAHPHLWTQPPWQVREH